jgi:hypothetical protein
MGKRRPDYARILSDRLGCTMLCRWCRVAKILHGETLEICGLIAPTSYDLWVAGNKPLYLVDGAAVGLAGKPLLRCLCDCYGSCSCLIRRWKRQVC